MNSKYEFLLIKQGFYDIFIYFFQKYVDKLSILIIMMFMHLHLVYLQFSEAQKQLQHIEAFSVQMHPKDNIRIFKKIKLSEKLRAFLFN